MLGEGDVEDLLKSTIEAAVAMDAVKPAEFDRVIVESIVHEMAVPPIGSRALKAARARIAQLAVLASIKLEQCYAAKGAVLRHRGGGDGMARWRRA